MEELYVNQNNNGNFKLSPIFVVGVPRSGTTMLAVMLNRHSRISIPPETQFFTEFVFQTGEIKYRSYEELVNLALSSHRIKDLELDNERLLSNFKKYNKNYGNLLKAILETYASKFGKERIGEKSPKHIEHVKTIINNYPNTKIVCIVRDGRDNVNSLLKMPWAHPGNPRRFGLFCKEWVALTNLAIRYSLKYPEQFLLVKYEDVILQPERELKKICKFIDEKFEPSMIFKNNGLCSNSNVVPSWENNWKSKAIRVLDSKRVEAWRNIEDKKLVWAMNSFMGGMLKKLGYQDTTMGECPWFLRAKLALIKIPYCGFMKPFSLFSLMLIRLVKGKNKQKYTGEFARHF